MANLDVLNIKGEKVETVALDEKVFDGKVNKPLLHQAVVNYLANRRQGTASTKTQGETRGGGRKPWRQKGTGRARVGSIRSPLWRGGGVVFGPHQRDYHYTPPKKIKRKALASALNAKLNDNALTAVDNISCEKPKTKEFLTLMKNLNIKPPALFVSDKLDKNTKLACRNIEGISLKSAADLNAYDILRYEQVVITKDALSKVVEIVNA